MTSTIEELIEEYTRRYIAGDASGVADLCPAPFLAVREGRAIHLPDREAIVGHFAGIMDAYRAAGFSSFAAVELDIHPLGVRAAFVTVRWHALDAAGRVARESLTTYHVIEAEPGWRFLSYTNHF